MKQHTNKHLRRALALFMTVLMAMSCFSATFGVISFAAADGSTLIGRYFSTDNVWYDAAKGANGIQWQIGDYPAYNAKVGMTYFNGMYVRIDNNTLFQSVNRDTGVTFAFNYRPNFTGDHRHILSLGRTAYGSGTANHFFVSGTTSWNSDGCFPMVEWVNGSGVETIKAYPQGVNPVLGKEYNIVVTVHKDDGVVFYVNGEKKTTVYKDSNLNDQIGNIRSFLDEVNTYGENYIGCSRWTGDAKLEGYLSDVRIYKTSVSDTEAYSLVSDMAGASFDLSKPSFNATAYHYSDPATGAYSNLAYASPATNSDDGMGIRGADNSADYKDIYAVYFKFFTPLNVVMVYDGDPNHETYASMELETKRHNKANVKDQRIYYVVSNSSLLKTRHNWYGYLDSAWTTWAGAYTNNQINTDTNLDVYVGSTNDTPRFWWNALKYTGTGNNDTYYDHEQNVSFTLQAFYDYTLGGTSKGTGTITTLSNYYVLNYKPVYDVLDAASAKYNDEMNGKAWMYTEQSYAKAMLAMRRLALCNPNLYDYAGRGVDAAAQMSAAAIKQAITEYNAINLVKKTGTVTFNYENGTEFQTYNVPYGDSITVPAVPTKTSTVQYDYINPVWSPAIEAGTVMSDDYKDKVYTASYTESLRSYDITWNYTTADGQQSVTTQVNYGTMPTAPEAATNDYQTDTADFTFTGWSPSLVQVEGEKNYIAQYSSTPRTYSITYKDGDTILTGIEPMTYTCGTGAAINGTYSKAGYTFNGWKDENGDPVTTILGNVYGDITLYADLTIHQHNIVWKNGDETVKTDADQDYGTQAVWSDAMPTTADAQYTYTAIGWNTDPDATTALDTLPTLGDEDLTLYAIYDKNDETHRTTNTYPVTITAGANTTLTVKNGDAVVNSGEAVAYGTELTIEAAADAAYTQHGVTVKVNGEAFTGTTYTVTGNTTITTDAIEETDINKYAVTISVGENTTLTVKNGEAVLTSGAEVPHGTVLTIEAAPTDGYSQQGVAVVKVNGEVYADATCTVTGDTAIATDPIDASLINTYTVTWKVDNVAVETDTDVAYGATPHYDGETPTKTDPTHAVTYTFTGWDGDINAAVYADTVFNAVFSATLNFGPDDIEDAIAEKLTGILNDEGDLPYGECYTEATLNAFDAAYRAVMDFEGEPKTDENVNALAAALDNLLAAAQALVVEHDWQDNWVGGHTHPHYDPEGLSTTNPAVNNKVCANDSTHTETVEINGATHYTEGDPNYADLYTQLNGLIALCTNADISATTEQALTEAFMALAAVGLDYTDSDEDEAALVEALNAAKVKIDALQTLVDADHDGVLDDGALKTYTITWNLEGGTSDSTTVTSGATPSHADDTKEATQWYTFNFDGWSPALTPATADATYTSTFSKIPTQALTDLIAAAQGIADNASDYDDTYQDEIDQIEALLDKYPDAITEEEIETLKDLVDEADAFVLYTITFVTYSIDIWPITAKVGSVVDLPDSAKDGYHFEGWYTDETFADGTKVTSPYTLTGDVTLYAFFEELSLNGDDVEAAIAAATAGVSGICYTEASYTAYTDAIAAVRAFKDQSATTENLTAYNNALSALDAAVAGLVEEHAYTGEPTITRPVFDEATGTWSKGVKTWTCANETSHPVKTEEVDRADYTTYGSVLDQISDLLDEDLTDDVKAALEDAKTALEAIAQNYIVDEQDTLDQAIQNILDTLKGNDKIDVDDDDTITVDPDTAYKTYTLKIYNNVNTDYMEFTHKAGTTAHLNPTLAGYTLKGFSANDNYNAETGIYTFPQADDTITALFVKDLTDNETITDANAIIADENNPDSGKDYDDDYIDDLTDLLDEIDAIKDDPAKIDELEEKLEDLQEMVDKAEENRAYTITWSIDGAETTEIYKVGATPTHADPVKDGYHFTGWDPAIAAVTADATYTAVFTEISAESADYTEYDTLFALLERLKDNDKILDSLRDEINAFVNDPLPRDLTADQQNIIDEEVAAIKELLDRIVLKNGNGDYTETVKESAMIHCTVTFYWLNTKLTKTVIKGSAVTAPNVTKMYGVDGMSAGHYVFAGWDKDFTEVTEDMEIHGSYEQVEHTGGWIDHPATCSNVAWAEITCTTCGLHFTKDTGTEKADHDWNEWMITPATCAHPGSKTRTCKNDASHTEFEVIPQLAHTDANGDTICDVCGNPTENHQHTDVNGDGKCDSCGAPTTAHVHNYQNGVCTGCGRAEDGSFRCNLCPVWERHRSIPVLGWILTAFHYFYHLIAQITSWR